MRSAAAEAALSSSQKAGNLPFTLGVLLFTLKFLFEKVFDAFDLVIGEGTSIFFFLVLVLLDGGLVVR
jgi:hypothetical protein